jgi:dTMP kinase
MASDERGRYIVLEGGEHVGKSTQAPRLAQAIGACLVREPGSTQVGEAVRSILLDSRVLKQTETEVLLHAAQRAELMGSIVNPALKKGEHVVSDRSWISSAAYQGAAGADLRSIQIINRYATQGRLAPDLLIVLDGDPRELALRNGSQPDYYEQMDLKFHDKVRENFLSLAETMGGIVIDAMQPVVDVSAQVRRAVLERI